MKLSNRSAKLQPRNLYLPFSTSAVLLRHADILMHGRPAALHQPRQLRNGEFSVFVSAV